MAATGQLRVVAISDTHGEHKRISIPPGDVFVHAGDFTPKDSLAAVAAFGVWVRELPHRYKLVIAGNHDECFQYDSERARLALGDGDGLFYLEDSGINIEGVAFWGSPWQPEFMDWAFNLPRGAKLAARWAKIPVNTDVLITHGPPSGILDVARGEHVGCADLLRRIGELRLKAHIFGHIHGSSGVVTSESITFVNASILNDDYIVSNPARVVDVDGARDFATMAGAWVGRQVYICWRASPFNDASEFGEGGFDEGVFTLRAFADGVLTLISGPSSKDIRVADVVAISET
jgi:predicted phosphohydrolase